MLKGKTIIFLGSSVTYGSGSCGYSFVDMLRDKDRVNAVKEAVSGTTLADINNGSYISRMKKLNKDIHADYFLCQLSTNDANRGIPLGCVSDSCDIDDFDISTVAGAIECIIVYAKSTWHCPVGFYTGTKFENEKYERMVCILKDISEKHKIDVLDLWNNEKMNGVSAEDRKRFMKDPIHPTADGYREWWLPEFEDFLDKFTNM